MRAIPGQFCLRLIHEFEGKDGTFERARAQDPSGNWEIGWSHRLSGSSDPLWDATIPDAEHADALAMTDLMGAAAGVCLALGGDSGIVAGLTAGQYAALIDFTYNVGVGAFRSSTLLRLLQDNNMVLAPKEFAKWAYARVNGIETILPGLVRRRAAELAAWNAPP